MSGAGDPPLLGRRVLLTRRPEQAAAMAARLAALGATVLHAPALDVVPPLDTAPLDEALRDLSGFDWLVFTSANAVRFTAARMGEIGVVLGARPALASVGPSTSAAAREVFPTVPVALAPGADFSAEGLLAAFHERGVGGARVLLPGSDRARDTLASGLRARGAEVRQVVAYRTESRAGADLDLRARLREGVDVVVLASPSAVEGWLALAGDEARRVPAAVIGPVTEEAARAAGLSVTVRARPSTGEGLVAALADALGGPSRGAAGTR